MPPSVLVAIQNDLDQSRSSMLSPTALSELNDRAELLSSGLESLVSSLRSLDRHLSRSFSNAAPRDNINNNTPRASLATHQPRVRAIDMQLTTTVQETVTVDATQTTTALFHLDTSAASSATMAAPNQVQTTTTSDNALIVLASALSTDSATMTSVPTSATTTTSLASSSSSSTQSLSTTSMQRSTSFVTSFTTTTLPTSSSTPTSTSTTFVYASPASQTSAPSATATSKHTHASASKYSGVIAGLIIGSLFLAIIFFFVRRENRKRDLERRTALSHNLMPWHPPKNRESTLLQSINSSHAHLVHEHAARAPIPKPPAPPQFLDLSHQAPSVHETVSAHDSPGTFYGSSPSRRRPGTPSSDVSSVSGAVGQPRAAQSRFQAPSFPPAHYDDLPNAVPAPRRPPDARPPFAAKGAQQGRGGYWSRSPVVPPSPLFTRAPRFPPIAMQGLPRQSNVVWDGQQRESGSTMPHTAWSSDSHVGTGSYNPFDMPQFP